LLLELRVQLSTPMPLNTARMLVRQRGMPMKVQKRTVRFLSRR